MERQRKNGEDVREKREWRRTSYDGGIKESLTFIRYDVYVQTGSGDCHTSLNFRGGFPMCQGANITSSHLSLPIVGLRMSYKQTGAKTSGKLTLDISTTNSAQMEQECLVTHFPTVISLSLQSSHASKHPVPGCFPTISLML